MLYVFFSFLNFYSFSNFQISLFGLYQFLNFFSKFPTFPILPQCPLLLPHTWPSNLENLFIFFIWFFILWIFLIQFQFFAFWTWIFQNFLFSKSDSDTAPSPPISPFPLHSLYYLWLPRSSSPGSFYPSSFPLTLFLPTNSTGLLVFTTKQAIRTICASLRSRSTFHPNPGVWSTLARDPCDKTRSRSSLQNKPSAPGNSHATAGFFSRIFKST